MEAASIEYSIEHAMPDDLPRVLDLWEELMNLTARYNQRYRLSPDARRRQENHYRGYFGNAASAILVARINGDVAAFCNIYVTRPSAVFDQQNLGVIENIYVESAHRRRGIAGSLVRRSHEFLKNHLADEVFVNVVLANKVSEAFWQSMGYQTQKKSMSFKEFNRSGD